MKFVSGFRSPKKTRGYFIRPERCDKKTEASRDSLIGNFAELTKLHLVAMTLPFCVLWVGIVPISHRQIK